MSRLARRSTEEKTTPATRKRPWLTVELLEDRTMLDASTLLVPDAFMIAMMEQASRTVAIGPVTQTKNGVTVTSPSLGTYTGQWLVGIYPYTAVNALTGDLGVVSKGATGLLRDTYVFQFNTSDPAEAYVELSGQRELGNVAYFYPLMEQQLSTEFVPNDPLYPAQYHLNNTGQSGGIAGQDARLQGAWDLSLGINATIAIVDNGVEYTHPDLAPNLWTNPGEIAGNGVDDDNNGFIDDIRGWDFVNNDNDPAPLLTADFHGTAVAGVAAARGNNGIGVSGAAPQARFVPIRLLSGEAPVMPTDLTTASAINYKLQNIDISNHSWGLSSVAYVAAGPLTLAAYQVAATTGRAGKGQIIVRSAGNNNSQINLNTLRNSRYTISVGAVNDSGIKATNSNFGAPLIVVAPSSRGTAIMPGDTAGITTTDIAGANGYNGIADTNYTNRGGDTSTASALVSGVVGLMISANPSLSYRDVQSILALSARRNDIASTGWVQNGAGRWVHHNYGYGVVDAAAAVAMASTWINLGAEVSVTSGTLTTNLPIPDNNTTGITVTTTLPNTVPKIEWAEVEINIPNHTWRGDVNIELTSPSGTVSTLVNTVGDSGDGIVQTFTSFRYLNESSAGTWSLKVWDAVGADVGTLASWKLNVYGNAPLIGTPDTYTTLEDTQIFVALPGVLSNDSGATSAQLVSTTTRGLLVFNTNGSFRYTPNANYNNSIGGPDTFTYRPVNGPNVGTLTTVTINITPVNDAPVANPDGFPNTQYIVKPGTTINIPARGVLLNDTDIDTNPLTLTAIKVSSTFRGDSTLTSNGAVSYTAYPNSSGTDFFDYVANDGQLSSPQARVTFRVNSQPVSVNDGFKTIVGQGVSGNVLINDSDLDLDTMKATLVATTPNGTLSLSNNGAFTYTPNVGFFGIDTFTYRSDDPLYNPANPNQVGNVATVSIRVDRLPVANPDPFTIKKNTVLEIFSPGVLLNDTDADIPLFGDVLQTELVSGTTNGVLTFAPNGYVKYVPNAGFSGTDSFSYRVTDGLFFGNTTTVTITVEPTPTAVPDSYVTFASVLNVGSTTGLLVNDLPGQFVLSARLTSTPANGAVTVNPDGSFVYTAGNGFTGVDQFTYVANDGVYDSDPATVTIMVFGINQPPVANDDAYATPAGTPLLLSGPGVLSNDTDPNGDILTATLVTGPTSGSLLLGANGGFSYVPQLGFQGIDTFTYQASDDQALSNIATVTITVGNVPAPAPNPARRIILGQEVGGELKVMTGETGQVLFTIQPYGASFTGGVRVATGDLNGDGVPDIITAPGPQTGTAAGLRVRAFNGVNGAPLSLGGTTAGINPFTSSYRGGIFVAAGDVNGDNIVDVVVSAQTTTNHGSYWVRTLNGVTGLPFPTNNWYHGFNPYTGTAFGGIRVATGDVNGDGRADIITSPIAGTPTIVSLDTTKSSMTAALIKKFTASSAGVYVAAGDINGDGLAEIITSSASGVQNNLTGQVRIYNGNTGIQIGNTLSFTGLSTVPRIAVGDIDGDGDMDLVVSISKAGQNSRARVYDALTLTELAGYENKFPYGGTYSNGLFAAALNKATGGVIPV